MKTTDVAVNAPAKPKIRLDIACGAQKHEGFVGIDVAKVPGVDIVHDLFSFPWPVEESSVEEAWCSHFVEHLPHREAPYIEIAPGGSIEMLAQERWINSIVRWGFVRDLWWTFWEQVHHVMAPDATITCVTPYYSSDRADQDPTHERRITSKSYCYLSQAWLERNRCAYPYSADFEIIEQNYIRIGREITGDPEREFNAVDDFVVTLRAKKPARCWWKKEA